MKLLRRLGISPQKRMMPHKKSCRLSHKILNQLAKKHGPYHPCSLTKLASTAISSQSTASIYATGASGKIRTRDPRLRRPLLYPTELLTQWNGRDDRIRTCDILLPKQARYQTALHPDDCVSANHNEHYTHLRFVCQGRTNAPPWRLARRRCMPSPPCSARAQLSLSASWRRIISCMSSMAPRPTPVSLAICAGA